MSREPRAVARSANDRQGEELIDLNDYCYFVHVVDSQGITTASKLLKLSKSTLSRRIAQLELQLGACLIQRSSRTFLVSELGWEFYGHARTILLEAQAAECAVRNRLAAPSGTLRIACSPLASALCLHAALPDFLARFPKVCVEQRTLSRLDEVGVRTADVSFVAHDAPLEDSSLIRRRLKSEPRHFFAAPAYASQIEHATRPEEIAGHPLCILAEGPARVLLADHEGKQGIALEPKSRLVSSDLGTVLSLVRGGPGVALLPVSCCESEIARGDLVRVLPGWTCAPFEVSALLPSSRGVLPAVRALIDFIGGRVGAGSRLGERPPLPSVGRHQQEEAE
ncbi:LysR substrate-binding domain-containing protein [Xanthobacter sp. KR7-225]|uniref:LysR substrate-binding domain-containing protein n=1 Tax=Xanthobacter sp. KR7-225 TaxID=3156613 RepID=UPI0032B3BFFF